MLFQMRERQPNLGARHCLLSSRRRLHRRLRPPPRHSLSIRHHGLLRRRFRHRLGHPHQGFNIAAQLAVMIQIPALQAPLSRCFWRQPYLDASPPRPQARPYRLVSREAERGSLGEWRATWPHLVEDLEVAAVPSSAVAKGAEVAGAGGTKLTSKRTAFLSKNGRLAELPQEMRLRSSRRMRRWQEPCSGRRDCTREADRTARRVHCHPAGMLEQRSLRLRSSVSVWAALLGRQGTIMRIIRLGEHGDVRSLYSSDRPTTLFRWCSRRS